MPNIVGLRWLPRRNIRHHPQYVRSPRAKSSLRCGKRLFRNIEDGDDLKTPIKKRFDPPRCAAADINNRRGSFDARCMNEIEGDG